MVCIWVTSSDDSSSKGLVGSAAPAVLKDVDPAALRENLAKLTSEIDTMLSGVNSSGGFLLESFEVGIEISAEAGINLIGTAKAGAKAAITLSFSKAKD